MGAISYYMALNVILDRINKTIKLYQSSYTKKCLHKFGMLEANTSTTPMKDGLLFPLPKENIVSTITISKTGTSSRIRISFLGLQSDFSPGVWNYNPLIPPWDKQAHLCISVRKFKNPFFTNGILIACVEWMEKPSDTLLGSIHYNSPSRCYWKVQ